MTKRYALRPRPVVPTTTQPGPPRAPTYPERPVAFRWYPPGWWVSHPIFAFIGVVEWSTAHQTKIVDGALFSTTDFVSCTARQVAALESRT